ncbi:MAG: DUF4394 domain-containing protein, partial [Wenzhouxiangella sp.]
MLVAGLTMVAAPPVFGQASADPAKFLPASESSGPVDTGEGYARVSPPSIEALRGNPDIVIVDDVNFPVANTINGSSINWVTGDTCNCDTDADFDFNPWNNNGNLSFWWWGGSNSRAGLSLNGTSYAVLGAGDTIGPASTFISVGFSTATVNWRQADNVDGYLGFRFDNAGTVNYGYVRLTTTGTTGFPATIVSYAYNQAGGPITIPFTTPVIEVSPASFEFTLEQGDSDTGALQIANLGSVTLDWDIEFEPSLRGPRSHDPALDEVLSVPDFTVVSPASGGTPEVFTVPAGILSSGGVVGFSFEGTVSGITGNGDWASDMCLQIEGPDGSSFSVGGIGATIPNCNVNTWDFQGSGSNEDGTYASVHDDVWPFPPGAADQGDWTLTFIHSWDSASANPMDWSNVTVTLHKLPPPEPCDFPAAVSWLSVDPASGSTAGGSADPVEVTVDSSGLAPGDYSANLCINSNDTLGNERIVVPVDLTVELTIFPEIEVSPTSLSGTAQEGASTDLTLNIGNLGTAELIWSIDEAPAAVHPRAHFPAIPWSAAGDNRQASAHFELLDEEWLAKREVEAGVPEWAAWPLRGAADPVPAFSTTSFSRFDYVSLDALEPGALTSIVDPVPRLIFAQTFIDDDFSQHFFIATGGETLPQGAYGFVDTETGVANQLGVLSGVPDTGTWTSAAWEPTSGAVYAVVRSPGDGNQLFEIDVAAGTGSLVGQITGLGSDAIVIAIAIDGSGLMYGLDVNADVLFALDKTDATAAVIGPLGVDANFAQDMDFDRSTNTLYWASYLGSGNSNMRIIDTSTGATTLIGPIQDGAELLSFSIALPMPPSCVTPAEVPWLTVDADSGSIQPGAPADEVVVTLDASALTEGTYNALLCIASNDPVIPLIEVPVEFVVDPADRIVTASVGTGQGDITPSVQVVPSGDDATFTVTPAFGWSVDSVVGDTCTPVNTGGDQWLAENIIEDCAVQANFVINTYTVTASVASGEGTITPPSQSVDHGSDATFTVTPATGWSL